MHIDMDCFFAQVEERENPQFKGKPVVVGADPKGGKGRGVVSTANYQARKYGIHSAMPISKAYQLCPHAIFLPVQSKLYGEVSERIMQIIRVRFPVTEQVSLDEAYMDVTKLPVIVESGDETERWKEAERLARLLRQEIFTQERLTGTCGVGPNKIIAKIACEKAKPNGCLVVKPEGIEQFLEPLDIEEIPGIGSKTAEILKSYHIATVQDLKEVSKERLEKLFGVRGVQIYEKARGIDEDPVILEKEIKSVGKEYTFEHDTRDPQVLIETFNKLFGELLMETQEYHYCFSTIIVKCRFSGFETHTKSKTLVPAFRAPALLRREAMKLFLRFIAENPNPIRLIGIRVSLQ